MNIFTDVVWEVKVDDMLYIWDVQTTGSYRGCNKNMTFARPEVKESFLSLPLLTVPAEIKQDKNLIHKKFLNVHVKEKHWNVASAIQNILWFSSKEV